MFTWELEEECPLQGQEKHSELGEGSQKQREVRLWRGLLPTACKAAGCQGGGHGGGHRTFWWPWPAGCGKQGRTCRWNCRAERREKHAPGRGQSEWNLEETVTLLPQTVSPYLFCRSVWKSEAYRLAL